MRPRAARTGGASAGKDRGERHGEARQLRRGQRVVAAELERDVERRGLRRTSGGRRRRRSASDRRATAPASRCARRRPSSRRCRSATSTASGPRPRGRASGTAARRREHGRATLRVPEQVGREDVALVDQHVDAATSTSPRPGSARVQHRARRRAHAGRADAGGLGSCTMTSPSTSSLRTTRRRLREVLLRRHPLGNRHRVHRTGLLCRGPLLPRGCGRARFAPPAERGRELKPARHPPMARRS